MKEEHEIDERLLRRRAAQSGARQAGDLGGDEEGPRARRAGGLTIARVGQERDLLGPRRLQRCHAGDDLAGVAIELCPQRFRELAEREPGSGHRRYGFFAGGAAGGPDGAGAAGPLGACWS
jgi:hypothetical protein